MDKKWFYWILVYFIAVGIFYFSSLPAPLSGKTGAGLSSWVLHIVEYAILSVVVYLAFKNDKLFSNPKISTMLFVILFAITDELHQFFVNGRVASIFDLGVDSMAGFIIAILV